MVSRSIPPTFQTQSRAIASYDYFDIAEGTGIKQFFLANTKNGTTSNYFLTSQEGIYSHEQSESSETGQGWSENISKTFDLTFQKPKDIKGKAYTQIFMQVGGCNVNNNTTLRADIYLYRVRDAEEEEIISVSGSAISGLGREGSSERTISASELDISNIYHFKKDDILRLKVKCFGHISTADGSSNMSLMYDPANRGAAVDNLPINSNILIPFRLDI